MKTVHIKFHEPEGWLLKELYKKFLKNDPLWHYVYWEDGWTHKAFISGRNIILRVSNSLDDVVKFLTELPETEFEVYEFPHPRGKFQLGISRKSWEVKYPQVSLPMLHAISEAKMSMKKDQYEKFIRHYIHIACNVGGMNHTEEAQIMVRGLFGALSVVSDWYKKMEKEVAYIRQKDLTK